jgi:hypothetical protein
VLAVLSRKIQRLRRGPHRYLAHAHEPLRPRSRICIIRPRHEPSSSNASHQTGADRCSPRSAQRSGPTTVSLENCSIKYSSWDAARSDTNCVPGRWPNKPLTKHWNYLPATGPRGFSDCRGQIVPGYLSNELRSGSHLPGRARSANDRRQDPTVLRIPSQTCAPAKFNDGWRIHGLAGRCQSDAAHHPSGPAWRADRDLPERTASFALAGAMDRPQEQRQRAARCPCPCPSLGLTVRARGRGSCRSARSEARGADSTPIRYAAPGQPAFANAITYETKVMPIAGNL